MQIAIVNGAPTFVTREAYASRCCCACPCFSDEQWSNGQFPCCGYLQQYAVQIPQLAYEVNGYKVDIRTVPNTTVVLAEGFRCAYRSDGKDSLVEVRFDGGDWGPLIGPSGTGSYADIEIFGPSKNSWTNACEVEIRFTAVDLNLPLRIEEFSFRRGYATGETPVGEYTTETAYGSYTATVS